MVLIMWLWFPNRYEVTRKYVYTHSPFSRNTHAFSARGTAPQVRGSGVNGPKMVPFESISRWFPIGSA